MPRKTKAEKAREAKYAAWLERRAIKPTRRFMVWRGQIITNRPVVAYVDKGMVRRRRAKSATPVRELEMRRNSTRASRRRRDRISSHAVTR